jgi:hypothetical protein
VFVSLSTLLKDLKWIEFRIDVYVNIRVLTSVSTFIDKITFGERTEIDIRHFHKEILNLKGFV